MRRLLTLCACVTIFTALAMAENWTGKLVDANCAAQSQKKSASTCDPTSATTAFAIMAGGHLYKFDDTGNSKAMEAMKSRADRSTNPNSPQSTSITARVTGTKDGDNTIKVESVEVQ